MRPTRAKINLAKVDNNMRILKGKLKPNTAIMGIVKANAYGHGIVEMAKQILKSGAPYLGVAIPEEGVRLRDAGVRSDILVLGGIDVDQIDLILDYDLTICLFSKDMAKVIDKRAKKRHRLARVHIKMDTGMGRIGVRDSNEALNLCKTIMTSDCLRLEGIFTHFACADACDPSYTLNQLEGFKNIINELYSSNIKAKWIHAANTASIINYPKSHFNLVRPGIGIYGYTSECGIKEDIGLEPVLSWHTKIVNLKEIEAGSSISYGRSFITKKPRRVATLPVGYGDGYNRLLSNKGWVIVKGRKAPIIGNICMDQMMVDVTGISNVEIGDDVVLIGKQGNESILANDLAMLCGTISYEILTNISTRVPRIYVGE